MTEEQSTLRQIDVNNNPDLVKKITDLQVYPAHKIPVIVQLVLDQIYERRVTDAIADSITCGTVTPPQHDGVLVYNPDVECVETWKAAVLTRAKEVCDTVAIKPIPTVKDIYFDLHKKYASLEWKITNGDWVNDSKLYMELIQRLRNKESGMDLIMRPGFPYYVVKNYEETCVRVCDIYKAVPSGKEIDMCIFDLSTGRWSLHPSLVAVDKVAELLSSYLLDVCNPIGIPSPTWIRRGGEMRAASAGIIRSRLYDKTFWQSMDGDDTREFTMFKNGIVLVRSDYGTRQCVGPHLTQHGLQLSRDRNDNLGA